MFGLLLVINGNKLLPLELAGFWVFLLALFFVPFSIRRLLQRRATAEKEDARHQQKDGSEVYAVSNDQQKGEDKEETKRCPFCAEEILAAATKCKHC